MGFAEIPAMFATFFNGRILSVVLWLVAAGAGFAMFLNYQNIGGETGATSPHWPAGTRAALDRTHDTLIMFAHPQCPCTRASVEELNRLLARVQDRVSVQVFFYRPGQFSNDWSKTDLWQSAAAIPNVTVCEDVDGAQAALFGAETSGSVFLYDPHGQLLFTGGITGSRGHAGDNAGEEAIVALCGGQSVKVFKTRVYGCSLLTKCDTLTGGTVK